MSVHPTMLEVLDSDQQAAVEIMENCVVAAGAGSGKTRVLAYRYAHLVIEHDFPVDTILTLTFTKKATAEMFERIYKTLKTILDSEKSTPSQKDRAKNAIENFHSSRIQTLDSYCSTIVRSASKQFGIRPDFAIDNEKIKDFCKQRAIEYMLEYRENSAMKELVGNDTFENVTESLFVNPFMYYSTIANEVDFTSLIPTQIETVLKEWDAGLNAILSIEESFESSNPSVNDDFVKIKECHIDSIAMSKYFEYFSSDSINYSQKICYLEDLKSTIIPMLEAVRKISKLNKSKKENKPIVAEIDTAKDSYSTLSSLAQYILYFPHTLELLPILQKYQSEITEWKRSSGILSYSDVSSLALKTLVEYPEIRKTEKEKFNAIMIDEFQDNNAMQKDMLFLLAEQLERSNKSIPKASELCPKKLFFVGDEKQSIYKFRGADVSVFRELKNELENSLFLKTNYRSHPELIAGFNSIFGGYEYKEAASNMDVRACKTMESSVFLQEKQLQNAENLPLFEAEYTKVLSNPDNESTKKNDTKRIHICLLDNTKEETEDDVFENQDEDNEEKQTEDFVEAENLAIFTAEKIAELCKNEYEPKDIAILFRSYSKQSMYEKHLRRLGIPYVAENITNFFGDAPTNDILSFIRLLVYPMDTMSFSVLLNSPFVRLTKQETLSCILSSKVHAKDVLFCKECAVSLQEDAKNRYILAMEIYNRVKEKAHNATCAQIIYELWYNCGYRYETMWNENVTLFSELYDYLFDIARNVDKEGYNLSYFVDYLYKIDKNSDRLEDMNIPLERQGAVQLMSIHKSKGLEFPVVFIAGITASGKASYNSDKIYVDKTFGPSLNFPKLSTIVDSGSNYFYSLSKNLESQMAEAELRRVLYVAMTRAESELYVTGSFTRSKKVIQKLEKNGVSCDFDLCKSDEEKAQLLYEIVNARFVCKLADKKNKPNNSQVQIDYCIQNNTLFAFLLPVIIEYKNNDAPFLLHVIDSVTREDILSLKEQSKFTPVEHVQQRITPLFEKAQKINTPIVKSPYRSPSQLSHTQEMEIIKNDNVDKGEHAIPELDEIIMRSKNKNFDYSHFGTIAHAYAESLFTKQCPKIPAEILNVLTEKELDTVCNIAKNMSNAFSESSIGKVALLSSWHRCEHDFKLLLKRSDSEKIFVKGQIDLVFENTEGKIVVLDYKTDSIENPAHHVAQLTAYRRAVSKIYARPIEDVLCILYYLRTGNTIDITSFTSEINLEDIAFASL